MKKRNGVEKMSEENRAVRSGWFAAESYKDLSARRSELTLEETDTLLDCKICPYGNRELSVHWHRGWDGFHAGFTLEQTLSESSENNRRLFIRED